MIAITMILIEIKHSMVTAELLGFNDYIPPFATARGQDILKGVNYGSGSVGIRDETGQQLVFPRPYNIP
ncbi:unnamed protein product [Ilex paraguariensis]|uniref:Uncharacterized protein n=1 Tax=Ilex paraguariensis TaxID=185542 RepID=A0ABC8R787_9AQUA